ncbi:VWA domain-containing protein [Agromyces sp. MMS24-K17]|uniref:VWA domain-containing protein n=1 Tax=Agromyces sp. MMS24-K17 TaxID=3372850 RepID=UPI003753EF19
MTGEPVAGAGAVARLDADGLAAWSRAQALWGVRMHEPELRPGATGEVGSFAWFGFPPAVGIDPDGIAGAGLADDLEALFAHELGHHVLAPGTRIDGLKIRHQAARAIAASGDGPTSPDWIPRLANLWNDLLVDARVAQLQRAAHPDREPGIVRARRTTFAASFDGDDRLWWVFRRAYELVWRLPAGSFCPVEPPARKRAARPRGAAEASIDALEERFRDRERRLREARRAAEAVQAELADAVRTDPVLDAALTADLVRGFASDPVSGALSFGMLAAPYLFEQRDADADADADRAAAVAGAALAGLAGGGGGACAADTGPATAAELGRILGDRRLHATPRHPIDVARAGGRPGSAGSVPGAGDGPGGGSGGGQSLGVAATLDLYDASDSDAVIAAWYRTEAARWVRPVTERRPDRPAPDLPGPLELWESGDDLADLDWAATLQAGPDPIAGVTTRRRSSLVDEPEPVEASIALDLYLDSSASMPTPRRGSPAVLAGTILALSVLRGGGRVRVTSFSGPGEVAGSVRFVRDPVDVVAGLAWYFGRSTSFPLDRFGERYARLAPPRDGERRHVVVISDEGLTSMFGDGNEPYAQVAAEVRTKLTTGTLLLLDRLRTVAPFADAAGYEVVYLDAMADAPAACVRLAEVLHG